MLRRRNLRKKHDDDRLGIVPELMDFWGFTRYNECVFVVRSRLM